ncbi:mechanosensitive ion channel domain-containing protein [Phenylobacterium sp.]|uniref:mechanosensitive ion channel family protein n=1 Tax=Phenylobacterium sp. TaxID=1871053 RepID=UPI002810CE9C|nr:mechanosensitive ion channel domain-containing protein [Phenylobacterium sp.]
MPLHTFIERHLSWAPPWIVGLVLVGLALTVALGLHDLLVKAVGRSIRRRSDFTRSLVVRTRGPSRLALVIFALGWVAQIAPLSPRDTRFIQHALLVGFVVLVGWMVQTALDIGSALYMRRYRTDVSDNLLARKHLTQIRILRRALKILVIILTAGVALMTIPAVRQVGVSLLAAGGAAGIIVGLALQPVLSNLIAGLQIALTQPIRIDDAVLIEGEFGNVEEITGTYVVVRLWDLRRLVVPLKYFLDQPFQNWTKESSQLLGSVMLYVDYSVPVAAVRAKFDEVVRASPLWDGQVANLQVTDARERTMELRCLMSARNSGELADLRSYVREQMITFLQTEMPEGLPRDRIEVFPADGAGERGGQPLQ